MQGVIKLVCVELGIFLAAGIVPGVAMAQESAKGSVGLEEIIVTARRREETLIAVPVAVTVLTSKDIESKGIQNLYDVALFTPGLTYFDAIQNQLGTPVIRGISQTNLGSPDRNVAMFYGGVYLTNNNATNLEILDVDRIEVVKGPQSALYGNNAFNGAINYVPAAPTKSFSSKVAATLGSDNRREVRFMVSGPLSDTFRARVAGSYHSFDGSWDNQAEPSGGLGGFETKNVSLALEFAPNEKFLAKVFGYSTDDVRESSPAYIVPAFNCGPTGRPLSAFCGDLPVRPTLAANPDSLAFSRKVSLVSLDMSYDFGPVTLKSQTSTYDADTDNASDNALGFNNGRGYTFNIVNSAAPTVVLRSQALPVFVGAGQGETQTKTQELRLEGKAGEKFVWGVGGFLSVNDFISKTRLAYDVRSLAAGERPQSDIFFLFTIPGALSTDPLHSMGLLGQFVGQDYKGAYFGSVEFKPTAALVVGAELRRDKENRERVNPVAGPSSYQQRTFEYTTWRTHADFTLSEAQHFYASAAKGVISGYFNGKTDAAAGNIAVPVDLQAYDPAENTTYEIGWKAQWLDRRIGTELAVYYIDYTGIQIPATPPAPLITNLVQNVGDATSKGFELSVNFAATDKLQLGMTYSYSPTHFKKGTVDAGVLRYCGGTATTIPLAAVGFCPSLAFRGVILPDVSGLPLPRSPNTLASAYAAFDTPLSGDWSMFARADGSFTSETNGLTIGLYRLPARTIVNARIGVRRGPLEVALWGRNVLDEKFVSAVINQPPVNATSAAFLPNVTQGERATYGLTASYSFGAK